MMEKISLYLAIISFIGFIISMAKINEYVKKKYPKLSKGFYKELHIPRLDAIFFPIKLFFSDLNREDGILKKWMMVYRISFLVFLISIITYFSMIR